MTIQPEKTLEDIIGRKWQYTFSKQASSRKNRSLLSGNASVGDPIIISVQPNLIAVAKGTILQLDPLEICVGIDRMLDLHVLADRVGLQLDADLPVENQILFRVDKDDMVSSMSRIRDSLWSIFGQDEKASRLRRLIVDDIPPTFTDPGYIDYPSTLNQDQRNAMQVVLAANDYALIHGYPGPTAQLLKERL